VARPGAVAVDQHDREQDAVNQRSSHFTTSLFFLLLRLRRAHVPTRPSVRTTTGPARMVSTNHFASCSLVCLIGLSSSDTASPTNASSRPSQLTASLRSGPDTIVSMRVTPL